MSQSTNLALPYLAASQSQKHVTVNEGLRFLDALVQISVKSAALSAPPGAPADGQRWIIGPAPTGLWAGRAMQIAAWQDGAWVFYAPKDGWLAWNEATLTSLIFSAGSWVTLIAALLAAGVADSAFTLNDDADPTKKANFELSGITTGTTRTFSLPNTTSELAILAGTQTFTGNKTFSGTLTASGAVTVSSAAATIDTATTTATYGLGTGATTTGVTKTVIIRLCMLTGARCGEARTATFNQFNLDLAIWTKQAAYTKQRRVHRVPISHEAVALIRLRGDAVPKGCAFLFPGDVPGQPVVDLKRFWERMRVQAEIPDVRIHDLRHTFASLLVSGGASLEMIGRLLGHTQIGTTQRYAHLIDSPLRAGVNAVGEMLKPRLRVVESDSSSAENRANVA